MSSNLQDSIVRITSSNPGESDFGTGFIIFRDAQAVYVLTCARVVKAVGGSKSVRAGGFPASVVALGSENDVDLAVLSVKALQDRPVLPLGTYGQTGSNFRTVGFQQEDKLIITPILEGVLGDLVGVEVNDFSEYIDAWFLEITNDKLLKRGNSGSPVVDKESGKVIAVVSHLQDEGKEGFALSIKALTKIWHEEGMSIALLKEIVTDPFSETEDLNRSGEASLSATAEYILTQEEREKLIALLCKLPNINYANVRHSLVSTLPAEFQSNIAFDKPIEVHISEIVDFVVNDTQYKLPDGSYPIMIVIQNALNMVKKSQLSDELQMLLSDLKDRLEVVPQIKAVPTSLGNFIQYLENFILQMPALQYELKQVAISFSDTIQSPECEVESEHLTEICTKFRELDTIVKQSRDLDVKSHRIWLMNALLDFNREAKIIEDDINRFCEMYGAELEEDQPGGERQKIYEQLGKLINFCRLVLEAAEKLYNELL